MRPKNLTVVIVKSFPLLVEVYRYLIDEIKASKSEGFRVTVETATDYQKAIDLFHQLKLAGREVDLVILNLKVFDIGRKGYLAGEDVGLLVRENHPETKIVFTSAFKNNYRINSILRNINPEGFLIKSDMDSIIFKRAIREVLNDSFYYSRSVSRWLNRMRNSDVVIDKWDRQLLYELSQNVKMKDLPSKLPLSLSTIEKRKKRIKSLFDVEEGDDHQLLLYARKFGFV